VMTSTLFLLLQIRSSRLLNSFYAPIEKFSMYEFFRFIVTEFDPNLSVSYSKNWEPAAIPSYCLRLVYRGRALDLLLADCDPRNELLFLLMSNCSKTSDDSIFRSESRTSLIYTCFISRRSKNELIDFAR